MTADLLADAYRALDHAATIISPETVVRLAEADGRTTWGVGEMRVTLPTMRYDAPAYDRQRYWARIVADAVGRCPLCEEIATLTADPEVSLTAWHLLPLQIAIRHRDGCPTQFEESDRHLFDPEAFR